MRMPVRFLFVMAILGGSAIGKEDQVGNSKRDPGELTWSKSKDQSASNHKSPVGPWSISMPRLHDIRPTQAGQPFLGILV
jgi:hypothetical protein